MQTSQIEKQTVDCVSIMTWETETMHNSRTMLIPKLTRYIHITQSWDLNFDNQFVHGVYAFFSIYNCAQNEDGLLWVETHNCKYVSAIMSCVWWLFISSFANTYKWRTSSLMQHASNSRIRQNHMSKCNHIIRNSVHNAISNTDALDGENICWIHCRAEWRCQNNVI